MNISYVKIQNYYENNTSFQCNSLKEFIEIINKYKNSEYSILEKLESDTIRFFMDIENIPFDQPNLIISIINDFIKFYNIPENYAYTLNEKSNHYGLSYHVYFPFKVSKTRFGDKTIYKLIQTFLSKHPQYYTYVDVSVYTKNRLFRVIGSCDPGITNRPRNQESFHSLIKGNIEDTIIQNYNHLSDFPYGIIDLNAYLNTKEYIDFRNSKINKNRFSTGYNKIIYNQQKQQKQILELMKIFTNNIFYKQKTDKQNYITTTFNLLNIIFILCVMFYLFIY